MADSENNGDKPNKATVGEPPELPPPSAPPHADVENPSSTSTVVMSSIIDRWKREDLLMKGNLVLRASAFVFALISFIVMASNKHGDWMNFDRYEEYRYCLAIAILACLYTGMQVAIKIYQFSTGRDVISTRASGYIGFAGDQIVAYLLISATSAAASLTNRMRQGSDNLFTDASAASVSMAFFAFTALALSAVISGFKLSHQSYI
ncbi:CASP-like protein 4B1 [Cinnamomum micranthum f. kanehirae]|uniref:CASP-like protein n=1 Tax=Cinnamomum micranthum f. kanehirae TaxID=337451 RepID=A0A3S3Q421_9MAGN|nr:CASP-like protein 4B1 [Cinnamomum micranthum f. kanehirae]